MQSNQQQITLSNSGKSKLTPKQIQVLAQLVSGQSYEGAANASGISPATIHSWMKTPAFNEEYKLGMERFRNILESRMNAVAQRASKVINEFLDSPNPEIRLEAAKVAINAAVRLNNRYKELQVQGFIAPAQPLVVFPAGTQLPWASKEQLPLTPTVPDDIIEADAVEVASGSENE